MTSTSRKRTTVLLRSGCADSATLPEDPRFDRRVARFASVDDGSYVWTRDVDGLYRLGRIDGPYRYDASAAAAAVDLVHVRACTWLPEPLTESAVPAAVIATFARGGRNFQQTHDAAAESAERTDLVGSRTLTRAHSCQTPSVRTAKRRSARA